MKITIFLILTIASITSFALEITLGNAICTGSFAAGSNCTDFTAEVSTVLNKDLPEVDIQKYADGVSNSMVIGNSGKGSDYGKKFDLFTLKLSAGIGLDASTDGFAEAFDNFASANGVGVGGALTGGINLDVLPIAKIGFIELSRMNVFFNIAALDIDRDIDSSTAKGSIGGFGFMARYELIEAEDFASKYLFQWGGLHLHTGFQRSTMNISYTQSFDDETVTFDAGGGISLNGTFSNSSGTIDLDSKVNVIPLEVSTYARFLYAFTLYGGLGMDIASGQSDINFNGSGTVTGVATGGGAGTYNNTMSANESSSGSPEATNFRGFVGLQLNVPVMSLFVHVNKNVTEDIIGLNLGANFSW